MRTVVLVLSVLAAGLVLALAQRAELVADLPPPVMG